MSLSSLQLTREFVQAVRDAVDIVDIASGYTKLQRAGRKWKGLCPLHKEKTPSFHVDGELGFFKCFGCGEGGDGIKLHMLLSGDDFAAAMETLARRYGVPLPPPRTTRARDREKEGRDPEQVLEAACEWFRGELARAAEVKRYLERRKIPAELVERYELGYAPDGWRNLIPALTPKYSLGDLLDVGLAVRPDGGGEPYDRFRNRLIFPIRNPSGRMVGFGGRTLGDDPAKYLNTAETARFHKGSLLYGLDKAKRAIRDRRRAFLVEGYVDVLASVACGIEGTVAAMGTALTPEQARLLGRFAEEVVLGYDGDDAGETACRRSLPILLGAGIAVRRARIGEGEDPDSLRLARGRSALTAAVDEADDYLLAEIERLVPADVHRNPHGRSRAARAATELLGAIPDTILRYGYARTAAERLGLPPQLLLERLGISRGGLETALATEPKPGSPGRRAEEEAIRLLLVTADVGEPIPPREALPPAEAFLDPDLRKFFEAFLRLYGEERAPTIREVVAEVREVEDREAVAAGLLLESGDSPARSLLPATLSNLRARWLKVSNQELARRLEEAVRKGDAEAIETLRRQKSEVVRQLHPGSITSAD
ncbi:MAG: DNA primase [Acidobacteria bacterium]|nr:DNA primase [Acidobacteriota bacterium]